MYTLIHISCSSVISDYRNCGIQLKYLPYKIIGGRDAYEGELPWVVHLTKIIDGVESPQCTGTLISPIHVVSAAHCLCKQRSVNDLRLNCTNKSDINVYIGSVESAKKGTKLSISNFKVHESYDAFTVINNDIAVIKLNISNSTLNSLLGKTINPICLANSKTTIKPGNYYVGSGWGKLGHDKPYATILQKADFKVVNESECKRHWLISDEMNMNKAICTEANKGVDACSVDSGGPLMTVEDGIWYLIGTVVQGGGPHCGSTETPTMFTNVVYYRNWILKSALELNNVN